MTDGEACLLPCCSLLVAYSSSLGLQLFHLPLICGLLIVQIIFKQWMKKCILLPLQELGEVEKGRFRLGMQSSVGSLT